MSFGIFQAIRLVPGLTWKNSMSNGRFQDSPGKPMYVHIKIMYVQMIYIKSSCVQMLSDNAK